ncbi:MAG: YfiR family protein [Cellvibrionaceae bacterium]
MIARQVRICVFLGLAIATDPILAQGSRVDQQNMVKSVFVWNIAKLVVWPRRADVSPSTQLWLCQYKEDLLGIGFEIIRNRSVNGRKLEKRTIDDLSDLKSCDALYIEGSDYRSLYRQGRARKSSKLLVSGLLIIVDQTNLKDETRASSIGHVTLFRRDEKIAFSVSPRAAQRSDITFDRKLIDLSTDLNE